MMPAFESVHSGDADVNVLNRNASELWTVKVSYFSSTAVMNRGWDEIAAGRFLNRARIQLSPYLPGIRELSG
jgi:hypothetical protein